MSALIDILYRQRVLSCAGFYSGALDGRWGPKTDVADAAFHAEYLRLQTIGGTFDPRTEAVIITLLPKAQAKAREFMRVAGPSCKLLSGARTYAEQHALFMQRPRVTKADAGQSNHNWSIAWDVGIFQNGHYLTGATHSEEAAYLALVDKIMSHVDGLEAGARWQSFKDDPHYNLLTGKTQSQIRALFEAGKPFV